MQLTIELIIMGRMHCACNEWGKQNVVSTFVTHLHIHTYTDTHDVLNSSRKLMMRATANCTV